MLQILCLFLMNSLMAQTITADQYMNDLLNRANSNPSSLTAADSAALSVYNNYRREDNSQADFARRYAVHVRNFFVTRLGNSREMTPDRTTSLQVFLNRDPRLIEITEGRGLTKVKDEADVVAKDYNARECVRAGETNCPFLTEREQSVLARLRTVARIRDVLENGPERAARNTVDTANNVANAIGNTLRRMGESTSHIIQCEVSPPDYKNCVTADGVTYVRSDNQAINNIREHVRKSRGNRGSFNQQRREARSQ